MAGALFASMIGLLAYVFAGYPLLAWLLARMRPRPVRRAPVEPPVTIVIAAYNEEGCLEETLKNKLSLDYPREKLEIIVVSDGSTDGTERIAASFAAQGVRLLSQAVRMGKTAGLNRAVRVARGEIIVFSDANSIYAADALRKLVRSFADPAVGYVTGRMVYANPDGGVVGEGCSTYMRYENLIRGFETAFGSVVGVDGGIDAVRKSLYRPMAPDQLPDFVLPLRVVEQGYRVVFEPEAVLIEPALQAAGDEYRMRVRVALRALWALKDMRHLLGFRRQPLFAWQLWSHKLLRYLCFLFLLGAWAANAAACGEGPVYRLLFLLQNVAYAGAILFPVLGTGARWRPLRFVHYFVLVNAAAAHAAMKFLLGQKQVVWTPRKG
jgi:cellulose synthase/poly-beta-1,6-N-acetylglucosamine synthase-like glycosyltransferase